MHKLIKIIQIAFLIGFTSFFVFAQNVPHPQADYLQNLLNKKGGLNGLENYLNGYPQLKKTLIMMIEPMANSQPSDWQLTQFDIQKSMNINADPITITFRGIRGSAVLFENFNFGGKNASIDIDQSEPDMKNSRFADIKALHNEASSAKVNGAVILKMFANPNFGGKNVNLTADESSFANDFNDKIASLTLDHRVASKNFGNSSDVINAFEAYEPVVKIQTPRGGEIWNPGGTYEVKWTNQRASGSLIVGLSEMNAFMPIVTKTVGVASSSCSITVPPDAKPGEYRLKIVHADSGALDTVSVAIRK